MPITNLATDLIFRTHLISYYINWKKVFNDFLENKRLYFVKKVFDDLIIVDEVICQELIE
jgi:hypothetical protein